MNCLNSFLPAQLSSKKVETKGLLGKMIDFEGDNRLVSQSHLQRNIRATASKKLCDFLNSVFVTIFVCNAQSSHQQNR